MSEAVRTAIAEAASTVDGVTVTAYFRQTTRAGDGMVRLDHATRDANGFGFVDTWHVLVLLPTDIAQAETWLETRIDTLAEAVGTELVISTMTPSELVLDNGVTVPAVVIEGHREHE